MVKDTGDKLKNFVISLKESGRLIHLINSGQGKTYIPKSRLRAIGLDAKTAAAYFSQITGDRKCAESSGGDLILNNIGRGLLSYCNMNNIDYNQ